MNLKLNFTLFLILLLIGCKSNGEQMTLLNKKPVFSLVVESYGVIYDLTVNDIVVQEQFDVDVQENFELPINQWFRSGLNKIGVNVMPNDDCSKFSESARLKITLFVSSFESDKKYQLSNFNFSPMREKLLENSWHDFQLDSKDEFKPSSKGDVILKEINIGPLDECPQGFSIFQELLVPSSLPEWAFFTSEDLPDVHQYNDEDYYAAVSSLMVEYQKIENAILSGDIDSVMPLFDERNKELDAAFYEVPGTTKASLKKALQEAAADPELVLDAMESRYLNFDSTYNSKVYELVRADGGAALGLNYKSGGSISFPIVYRRENGKWIITR